MRIVALTSRIEEKMLAARQHRDAAAESAASRIVNDVRRRGDAALFAWTQRLDGMRVTPRKLWASASERRAAARAVPKVLRASLEHAARNIRRVPEAQLPPSWSIAIEPGVRVRHRVPSIDPSALQIAGWR